MRAAEDPCARRTAAFRRLPVAYAFALRLRAAGIRDEVIAACLGVEPEALGPLWEIAEAKLAALLIEEQQV